MAEAGFQSSVHTVDARNAQLDLIFEGHPEVFLVGSVARAAIVGHDASVDKGRIAGVRDVDVCSVNGDDLQLSDVERTPFPVDIALNGLITMNSDGTTANVLFDRHRPDVSVELPGVVFEPYWVTANGVLRRTFHPDTMLNLHRVSNTDRPKDKKNLAEFRRQLEGVQYQHLPQAIFEPLEELSAMVDNDTALSGRRRLEYMRSFYFYYLPRPVRSVVGPVLTHLKHRLAAPNRGTDREVPRLSTPSANRRAAI